MLGSATLASVLEDARAQHEAALAEYHRITKYLKRRPIRPGWVYQGGQWILRGEYSDIPRRFLDLRKPSGPPRSLDDCQLGDEDDLAGELGFTNGDDLREHLRTLKRPTLGESVESLMAHLAKRTDSQYHNGYMASNAERQAKILADRAAKGLCKRCPSYLARPATSGTLCDEHRASETARVDVWRKKRRLSKAN